MLNYFHYHSVVCLNGVFITLNCLHTAFLTQFKETKRVSHDHYMFSLFDVFVFHPEKK